MAGTAFLGGAFDPVHRGHLRLAHAVKERLNLESVEFIPNAAPRTSTARICPTRRASLS